MIVIDPGAQGGIVSTGERDDHVIAMSMPKTEGDIINILNPGFSPSATVYLEDLVKFAGRNMPSSAMATYAGNWGFLKGAAMAFGYRVVLVPPKAWQKALGLGGSKSHANKTAWKNHLKQRAEQLFPKIKVTLATADALLIYEAARRGLIG